MSLQFVDLQSNALEMYMPCSVVKGNGSLPRSIGVKFGQHAWVKGVTTIIHVVYK